MTALTPSPFAALASPPHHVRPRPLPTTSEAPAAPAYTIGSARSRARGDMAAGAHLRARPASYLDRIERIDRSGPTLRSVLRSTERGGRRAGAVSGAPSGPVGAGRARLPVLIKDNRDAELPTPRSSLRWPQPPAGTPRSWRGCGPRAPSPRKKCRVATSARATRSRRSAMAAMRTPSPSPQPVRSSSGSGAARRPPAAATVGTTQRSSSARVRHGVVAQADRCCSRAPPIVPISHSQDTPGRYPDGRRPAMMLAPWPSRRPGRLAHTEATGASATTWPRWPGGAPRKRIGILRSRRLDPDVEAFFELAIAD